MRHSLHALLIAAWLCACPFANALAASGSPETLGKFDFWTAYKMTEGKHPVCYMSLTLRAGAGKNASSKNKRSDVMLMITHRPDDNSTDVVSYTAGLKFKPSTEATFSIGGKKFSLFTQGDTAWSRDVATDHALAAAIRSNGTLLIEGLTTRNTAIADKLNLKGAYPAYVAMNKACGLPSPPPPARSAASSTKTKKAARAKQPSTAPKASQKKKP